MKLQHVKSFEGSPEPEDIFQPHMPGVELLSDMDEVFRQARRLSATGEYPVGVEGLAPEAAAEVLKLEGQHSVAIVTPGRALMPVPAPKLSSVPQSSAEAMRKMLSPDPPQNISVVSYTYVKALVEDKSKAVPFLGILVGLAAIGHTVVVFEGHSSAFESGVRESNVLVVDSGMLPFIQEDWKEVAFRVMRPGAQLFVHDRKTFSLSPVVSPGGESGQPPARWRSPEMLYADYLIAFLSSGPRSSVEMTSGEELPDLADFAKGPEQLEKAAALPFKREELDADRVIDLILYTAGRRWYHFFKKSWMLKVPSTGSRKTRPWMCSVKLTKDARGRRRLLLER
jgi:hypothetical protein